LVFLSAAVVVACSGSSDKPTKGGTGAKPAAGKGGSAGTGKGGSVAMTGGGEAGDANSSVGGSTGGTAGLSNGGGAGFAARGGMGAFAGVTVAAGTGGSLPMAGTGSTPVPPGWNCAYSAYNDGVCDCGCAVRDADCGENDISECERCNTTGSCDFRECPGKIDPDNITRCIVPPAGWTCSSFYYADGECDCGCGVVDVDCKDDTADSCKFCAAFGACSGGECPGPIDPKNNAVCKTPDGWTCLPFYYADGTSCDCGCGIVDPDCESADRNNCNTCWNGCSDEGCPGPIDEKNNAICTGVPSTWRCKARFYNDGICDCGCGAVDYDCDPKDGIDGCTSCNLEGSCSKRDCATGTVDTNNIGFCTHPDPPAAWKCSAYRYADGYTCDCGCGAVDLDCPDDTAASCQSCYECGSSTCPGLVDPTDISACIKPPQNWYCQTYLYGDGYCDCGCGAPDPDCADNLKTTCKRCSKYEGSCSPDDCSTILPMNNALCTNSPPPEWTCPLDYYNDKRCDCGCGIKDVDCVNAKRTVCQVCNSPGSCSDVRCKDSDIDANDNSKCTAATP